MEIVCSEIKSLIITSTDYERMKSEYKIRNIQTQVETPLAFCKLLQINKSCKFMHKDKICVDS